MATIVARIEWKRLPAMMQAGVQSVLCNRRYTVPGNIRKPPKNIIHIAKNPIIKPPIIPIAFLR